MNPVPLLIAIILMLATLSGRKGRLIALAVGWVAIFPALMPLGLRSAIFVPELIIAAAFIPWIVRKKEVTPLGTPGWFSYQIAFLVPWAVIVTIIGWLWMGQMSEVLVRAPLAGARIGGALLAFAIPASTMLNRNEFKLALRFLTITFLVFAGIALLSYLDRLPFTLYYQASAPGEDIQESAAEGGITRPSLGSLSVLGMFVCIIAIQLKCGSKAVNIAGIVTFLFLLLTSHSRTALISASVGVLTMVLLHRGNRIRNMIFAIIGVVTVALVISQLEDVAERFETLTSLYTAQKTSGRLDGWQKAITYIVANPQAALLGVGYDVWSPRLNPVCGLTNGHNGYLHAWGELGILGGALYVALFIRIAKFYYSSMQIPGDARKIGGVALAYIIALLVANLTITGFYPAVTRITFVHALMFTLGATYGHLRYLTAEHLTMSVPPSYPIDSNGIEPPAQNATASNPVSGSVPDSG